MWKRKIQRIPFLKFRILYLRNSAALWWAIYISQTYTYYMTNGLFCLEWCMSVSFSLAAEWETSIRCDCMCRHCCPVFRHSCQHRLHCLTGKTLCLEMQHYYNSGQYQYADNYLHVVADNRYMAILIYILYYFGQGSTTLQIKHKKVNLDIISTIKSYKIKMTKSNIGQYTMPFIFSIRVNKIFFHHRTLKKLSWFL